MSTDRKSESSDLSLIAQAIRRRLKIVIVCLVVGISVSVALTIQADKQYAASSSILLNPSSGFEPQRTVETNLELLDLPLLAKRTAEEVPGTTSAEVSSAIEVSQQGESNIVRVQATADDPEVAAGMANSYAEQYVLFQEGGNREEFAGRVRVVERAIPDDTPVSPKPVRNVVFGALIGLVLGLAMALLLEQLDRRVKRQEELPRVTGLPLVATVPKRQSFDREHLGDSSLSPAEAEIFLMLRANLRYFNVRKDIRSVLVTSADPGEGKSLVSLGLALGASMSGERALLIEADMRDPSLSNAVHIDGSKGLSTVLAEPQGDLSDVVVSVDARGIAAIAGDATLDFLPAGPIPPNPTELAASGRMKSLLARAESDYDFVIIDTPPILLVADAIPLISMVSGVLAVSGLGVSTQTSANDLADQLERMDAPTLGLVANFATDTGRSYEGYGYGRPPEVALSAEGDPPPVE